MKKHLMKIGKRRILHQPLFPIQWTPPPPRPPASPVFSSNPVTSTSSPPPPHHDHSTTKIVIIVASISVSMFFFLSLLFSLFQQRRVHNPRSKSKREALFGGHFAPAGDGNSEVGSTEPISHIDTGEMVRLEFNHPSPEIKPLPPLLTGGVVEWSRSHPSPEIKPLSSLPRQSTDNVAASEEHVPKVSTLERSYSWSGTTRFSIGSSPNLQQQSPLPAARQPVVDFCENVKVQLAGSTGTGMNNSDGANAWGKFKSRSFMRLDDDMIEIITPSFGKERMLSSSRGTASLPRRKNRVLGSEKAESIEILLRTSSVKTEDACEALLDGGSEFLGTEFLDSLAQLAPTKEEEFLLRHFRGEVTRLNAADRFLKALLDVPFAMKRIEVMLYQARFETNIHHLKNSFQTLQDACEDLRRNKLFRKLLEAANSMRNQLDIENQEDTNSSGLESLLQLCNAKEEGRKVTPLHYTVEDLIANQKLHSDIIKEEECKKKGLRVVAGLSAELDNVKKAAEMDLQMLRDHVKKQDLGLEKVRWLLQLDKACNVGEKFFIRMKRFANEAEMEIENVKEQEEMTSRCIGETTEHFNLVKDSANPLRILILVRDFLLVLDGVCKDIGRMQDKAMIGSLSGRFLHFSPVPSAIT